MKIALFERNGETCVGKVSEDRNIIQRFDLSLKEFESLGVITLIGNDPPLLTEGIPIDEVSLLAPIPRPLRNIFCVGKNYLEHAHEFTSSGFDSSAKKGQ